MKKAYFKKLKESNMYMAFFINQRFFLKCTKKTLGQNQLKQSRIELQLQNEIITKNIVFLQKKL